MTEGNEPLAPRRNLERKTRCADLSAAASALRQLGARCEGTQEQRDTYFPVPSGRLKLRVIDGRTALLIAYARSDETVVRPSDYYLVSVNEPDLLRAALTKALGVRGEVRKRRTVWHWHNVRIHLDDVAGRGTFLEFEAVLSPDEDEAMSRERLDQLGSLLGLTPADDVAGSYGDVEDA
jgi:adenylate cyclase class 2